LAGAGNQQMLRTATGSYLFDVKMALKLVMPYRWINRLPKRRFKVVRAIME